MPTQEIKRGRRIELRVSNSEFATVEERARAAGLTKSEYIRREAGIGHFERAALQRRPRPEPGHVQPENQADQNSDFQQRVQQAALRMPRRNAETLVRKEEARERARDAIGS